ncbi:hypothetical protein [Corynebacterium durum]|uniref:hypothetical protein n=1 Tax=Corynebacterium durum TaxID=61592 RepID=UPI0028E68E89|nr:hypothetical protein [Corynebacterium durum]
MVAVIVSIVATVIALWAAYESRRANTRADAANQLAEESNQLAKESNKYAAKSNEISSQALELTERLAPAPLSELTKVSKNTWAFRNESGRPIELLSITTVPADAEDYIGAASLPQVLEYGDHYSVQILEAWGTGAEALMIEWKFADDHNATTKSTRRNVG